MSRLIGNKNLTAIIKDLYALSKRLIFVLDIFGAIKAFPASRFPETVITSLNYFH